MDDFWVPPLMETPIWFQLRSWIEDFPPLHQPMRFGNKAFRSWRWPQFMAQMVVLWRSLGFSRHQRLCERSEALLIQALGTCLGVNGVRWKNTKHLLGWSAVGSKKGTCNIGPCPTLVEHRCWYPPEYHPVECSGHAAPEHAKKARFQRCIENFH